MDIIDLDNIEELKITSTKKAYLRKLTKKILQKIKNNEIIDTLCIFNSIIDNSEDHFISVLMGPSNEFGSEWHNEKMFFIQFISHVAEQKFFVEYLESYNKFPERIKTLTEYIYSDEKIKNRYVVATDQESENKIQELIKTL